MNNKEIWNTHYTRDRSILTYPDENLVRLLKNFLSDKYIPDLNAIDIGCGSGRHIALLKECGLENTIATDMSYNSVEIAKKHYQCNCIQCYNDKFPFENNVFDLAICWGSLHYSNKDNTKIQVEAIKNSLKQNGVILGTMRSTNDSSLRNGKHLGNDVWETKLDDINNTVVSFFNKNELLELFSDFTSFEYGLIQRTPLNELDKIISHWYFKATK